MNEKGFMMPLMLGICVIFASLLLTMAGRLESQSFSYSRRQLFQKMSLLEMEATHRLYDWLETADNVEELPEIWLAQGLPLSLTVRDQGDLVEIGFQFTYNGYLGSGTLNWRKPDEPEEEAPSPDWHDGERKNDDWESPLTEAEPELDRYGPLDSEPDEPEYP